MCPALPLPDTHAEETLQQVCEGTYEDVLWGSACNDEDEIWTQLNACQEGNVRASLVVQWLRLPFSAVGVCLIPGQGTKIPHAPGQLSLSCNRRICGKKLPASTKTPCSQINNFFFKKEGNGERNSASVLHEILHSD